MLAKLASKTKCMAQKHLPFDFYSVTQTSSSQQLSFYFVLLAEVVFVSPVKPHSVRGWPRKQTPLLSFAALWTHLIQSEPLVLSTHQLGVYYLGVINWTCFIAQCVVELVTHGWKKYLSKKKKKTQPCCSQLSSGLDSYSCYTAPGCCNYGQ